MATEWCFSKNKPLGHIHNSRPIKAIPFNDMVLIWVCVTIDNDVSLTTKLSNDAFLRIYIIKVNMIYFKIV